MQIANEVLAVVSALEIQGNTIKMQKLERGLYLKVDKVLQAMGGKWDKKAQAHLFNTDPTPIVEQVLALGEITTHKDLGFFRTPSALARHLVELADVRSGHLVLEPSAGDGAIVKELLRIEAGVFAIERDDRRREALIHQSSASQTIAIVVSPTVGYDDFMDYEPIEPFDRVVMNPPFLKCGKGDHLDHVRHAFSMLVPGGVLVSVLPAGVKFRQDRRHREFREWVDESVPDACRILDADGLDTGEDFEPLPDDAFKASGTSVRTVVLRMLKG